MLVILCRVLRLLIIADFYIVLSPPSVEWLYLCLLCLHYLGWI